ncbi:MAG: hypothetical protein C0184_12375 [Chloroflexus aggregans]|uniref:Uncharacterized protein n=1 Tax=Chloroflexus aggregans TaxID=152260 RepID=A0A2J6WZW7_9CHLR|nr:MAG: hypothetical protein C0184_12375 [Chloroflexus aggregans]
MLSNLPPTLSEQERQALVKAALRRCHNGIGALTASLILMIGAIVSFWIIDKLFDPMPFHFIIPLFFTITSISLLIESYHRFRFHHQLRQATTTVEAPIIDIWIEFNAAEEPTVIAWELIIPGTIGQRRLRQAQVIDCSLRSYYQQLKTVKVRYNPTDPSISALVIE